MLQDLLRSGVLERALQEGTQQQNHECSILPGLLTF